MRGHGVERRTRRTRPDTHRRGLPRDGDKAGKVQINHLHFGSLWFGHRLTASLGAATDSLTREVSIPSLSATSRLRATPLGLRLRLAERPKTGDRYLWWGNPAQAECRLTGCGQEPPPQAPPHPKHAEQRSNDTGRSRQRTWKG